MKKLLALLLVVAFALSAVACSSQEAQTEPARDRCRYNCHR